MVDADREYSNPCGADRPRRARPYSLPVSTFPHFDLKLYYRLVHLQALGGERLAAVAPANGMRRYSRVFDIYQEDEVFGAGASPGWLALAELTRSRLTFSGDAPLVSLGAPKAVHDGWWRWRPSTPSKAAGGALPRNEDLQRGDRTEEVWEQRAQFRTLRRSKVIFRDVCQHFESDRLTANVGGAGQLLSIEQCEVDHSA
jgi:hypothetical protein